MRRARLLLASITFVLALATPGLVRATTCGEGCKVQPTLSCGGFVTFEDEDGVHTVFQLQEGFCDLGIDKQVSVSGGPFVEADTSPAAAQALPNDTITWKVTVDNHSGEGLFPSGTIIVSDMLPGGVIYDSSSASSGSYNNATHQWQFNVDGSTTYPLTLTINSHPAVVGTDQNTATLSQYDPNNCGSGSDPCGFSTYIDGDSSNNSNDAWVTINNPPIGRSEGSPPPPPQTPPPSNPPQVLGLSTTVPNPPQTPKEQPKVLAATTLANTGSGLIESLIAGLLAISAIAVAAYGRLFRKRATYKLFS